MKTLVPRFEAYDQILSLQKEKKNVSYRWSTFSVRLSCADGTLLYNSMTGALYLIEKDESEEILRKELISSWCLVPSYFDELKYSQQLRDLVTLLQRTKYKTSFNVVTTTDCNARCFYCFERGCMRIHMSTDTAHDAVTYMLRVSGDEELKLMWFGGEPLYNRKVIEIITAELHAAGRPFHSLMITNGYFLDAETAITAKRDWGLRDVQISLDGTKENYERTKAYLHPEGSPYERVMNNIDSALEVGIRVLIRLNIDGKNAEDLFKLADDLGRRFAGKKNMHVYVFPLQEYTGKIPAFTSEDEAEAICIALQEKLDALWPGYCQELPRKPLINSCMADNDSVELIMPDGGIEKCEHIQHRDFVGTIYDEQRDTEIIQAWKERAFFPECEKCAFCPQCILLKRCDKARFGCSKADRALKRRRLQKQILYAYQKYIEEEEAHDETK